MSFTIWSRLRALLASSSGRRHLAKTWKFSSREAFRAASGLQISEILFELEKFGAQLHPTLRQPDLAMISGDELSSLAKRFSAGKQSGHSDVYSLLDLEPISVSKVLEIGIGSNDESAASSMGKDGVPGASLRMWEHFFPNSHIYGADIELGSHIFSERVTSFYLDSTRGDSLLTLRSELSGNHESDLFDLVIDDGLHTPESNLRVFNHLYPLLRLGGFYVVEDIPQAWKGFWEVFAHSLPSVEWRLVDSLELGTGSHCFLVMKRIG